MFEFLKNIFKKEVEQKEIKLNELVDWFSNKTNNVSVRLNEEITTDFNEIKEHVESLKANLEVLSNAEIKDADKIQDKVKHIVLGHRGSYCRILAHFANSIEIPTEINHIEGKRASYDIDESLNELGKTTIKSYQAVQHLFHDDLELVTKDLKKIVNLNKQIKLKIEKSKSVKIEEIKKEIKNLFYSIKQKKELNVQVDEQKKELLGFEKKEEEYNVQIKDLKQSGDYQRLNVHNDKLGEIEGAIKHNEHGLFELFSPIETGLKKFKRITLENEKLIDAYLDSFVKALFEDNELKIIGLLSAMKKSILSGSINLKDKKKDKVLKGIDNIELQKLKQIISEHEDLLEKKDSIKKSINSNPVKSQIKELEYKIEHNSFKITKLKEDITDTEKKTVSLDLEILKQDLVSKIKDVLDIEIKLV